MWRVILRFSLDKDQKSVVRNELKKILEVKVSSVLKFGFTNVATGIWETKKLDPKTAASIMSKVLDVLSDPTALKGASDDASLDHLWLYIDRA